MEIYYQDRKLAKTCNSESLLAREYGPKCAVLIRRRLRQFGEVENLEALRSSSKSKGRCHELKGERAGTLAVDVKHPYRLIFEPANDPLPRKPDGGLDWAAVTAIRILSVEDYHG